MFAVSVVAPVPPLATGSVPVICDVRSTPDNVPPSVSEPDVVTVPVSVMPLTVPVPLTEVTVPVFDVNPLGLVAGYAPSDVRALAAVEAPVPPFAIGRTPDTPDVSGTKLQLAAVPSVVTNFPALPLWPGSAAVNAVPTTKAVVAICVVFVPADAVGAVGVPVRAGLAESAIVVPVPLVV